MIYATSRDILYNFLQISICASKLLLLPSQEQETCWTTNFPLGSSIPMLNKSYANVHAYLARKNDRNLIKIKRESKESEDVFIV